MRWLGSLGLVGALLLFAPRPARAERSLALDEALTLARANNKDLRAAKIHLEGTATNIDLAWAALLPTVTAQGKYTHNYKNVALNLGQFSQSVTGLGDAIKGSSGNPAETAAINQFEQALTAATAGQPAIVIQKGEQLDLNANATVPIVVPYAYGALRAARLSQRSNAANFEVTEASVLLSVAETFYTAAGADELVRARQNAVSVANQTWQDAKARVAAGFVNAVEATRAEVSLVVAVQDEAEAENTRASVYRSLRTLLGMHEGVVVAPLRTTPAPVPSVPALVARARSLRPEFAEYRAAVESANATESSNAWRWAPTLAGFGTARLSNYRGFAGDKYAWAVGAELDWTLYDGGTRDAERRRASADARENSARLEQLADSIADEVANAAGTLETKRRALDAAKRARDLSEDTLRIVRAQYAAGTASELAVLDAQDSFVSAEVALVRAHFDFSLADLELQKAAGLFPPKSAE